MIAADSAERHAVDMLGWLAGREADLRRFVDASGVGPAEMRQSARDPAFLGFVVDFLLSDEALLLAYCDDRSLPPETPARVRAALPGGDDPHWT